MGQRCAQPDSDTAPAPELALAACAPDRQPSSPRRIWSRSNPSDSGLRVRPAIPRDRANSNSNRFRDRIPDQMRKVFPFTRAINSATELDAACPRMFCSQSRLHDLLDRAGSRLLRGGARKILLRPDKPIPHPLILSQSLIRAFAQPLPDLRPHCAGSKQRKVPHFPLAAARRPHNP